MEEGRWVLLIASEVGGGVDAISWEGMKYWGRAILAPQPTINPWMVD
jgi:hypothetical protein